MKQFANILKSDSGKYVVLALIAVFFVVFFTVKKKIEQRKTFVDPDATPETGGFDAESWATRFLQYVKGWGTNANAAGMVQALNGETDDVIAKIHNAVLSQSGESLFSWLDGEWFFKLFITNFDEILLRVGRITNTNG